MDLLLRLLARFAHSRRPSLARVPCYALLHHPARLARGWSMMLAVATVIGSAAHAATPESIVASRLGLTSFTLQHLRPARAGAASTVSLELEGRRVTLRLAPASVRGAAFRLLAAGPDGSLAEVPARAARTWRGTVEEIPGSVVGGTIDDAGLSAVIALADGRLFYVQPAPEAATAGDRALHVVYAGEAATGEGVCGAHGKPVPVEPSHDPPGTSAPNALRVAELAIDTDYELYEGEGSSVDATLSDLETVMNAVNVVYERDCNITHVITTLIVRSSPLDPYDATDSEVLLDQFGDHWNASQTAVTRDLAHLMTGKNLDGGTIGIAWLGVVCSHSNGYGLSQTLFSSTLSRRCALTAHEIGHNWNADHCDGATPCNIMCSSIDGCSGIGLPNFEPQGIQDITSYAATRSCLNSQPTAVGMAAIAGNLELAPASPTPFSHQTSLRFFLERPATVRLAIFDVSGHRVATLVNGMRGAGWHTCVWDGLGFRGTRSAPGAFFARLEADGAGRTRKIILMN